MKIAIIDADLIGRKKHRFPNLACMKISSYYKNLGNEVSLKLNYDDLQDFNLVFISKVFTDTIVPENILNLGNVKYGGTGFFYDKAPKLDDKIEHSFPDYDLYSDFVLTQIEKGKNKSDFKYYTDYSIGFTTRGCFRKCSFCVNKNYNKVEIHSPLSEFYDSSRPKICLLDDNFLGYNGWRSILDEIQKTKKPFQFKQGLDERILTEDKCEALFNSKYDGDYIFAFDDIKDSEIIEKKLKLIRTYTKKIPKFYVFCGFDRNDKYDHNFWVKDIEDIFKRIEILIKYNCIPYIMRHEKYNNSPYRGMYINLARWCNQPSLFKKKSFIDFCKMSGCDFSPYRYANIFMKENKDIAEKYYNLKWNN